MTGERYGRLVGVAYSHTPKGGRAQWLFVCDCGTTTVADGGNVRRGSTASCGCLHREVTAARLTIHGHRAAGRHGPTYRAWQQLKDACGNPKSPRWEEGGGGGIVVCASWNGSFERFLHDMGPRPAGTMLQLVNDAHVYSGETCAWISVDDRDVRARQGWNKRRRERAAYPSTRTHMSTQHTSL
jgi:hypothetical protein